jgi:hypothetical protein
MKKNKAMRLAAAMMALTLVTSSVVSGTFAKYVSEGSAGDTARVAKWGVVVTSSGSLFSNAYLKEVNTPASVWGTKYTSDSISVATATKADENIVAPGTKSADTGLTYDVSGTPEVATELKATVTGSDIVLAKDISYAVMVKYSVSAGTWESEKAKLYTFDGSVFTSQAGDDKTFDQSAVYYILTNDLDATVNYFPVVYSRSALTTVVTPSETEGGEDVVTTEYQAVTSTTKDFTKAHVVAEDVANGVGLPKTDQEIKIGYDNVVSYGVYTATQNFDAGTDLSSYIGNEKMTWAWDYGAKDTDKGFDKYDTVLGDMIAAAKDDVTDYIVAAVKTTNKSSGVYYPVTYGVENGCQIAYCAIADRGIDLRVANLTTSYEVAITATQLD